ncbi:hypothetical protein CK203_097145 [Vitis vinifera]|uniref:Uncharacterized protein n=1 Tax=Vitis vinifera TaxID=29760 RepID=A0A438CG05_VITVI|nr:hypothetical protein CK203_097145 [Vitis vinifera]
MVPQYMGKIDARFQPIKVLDPAVYTYKKVSGQGVRTHPPMILLVMALVGASSPYTSGCQKPWWQDVGHGCLVVIACCPDVCALPATFALPWIGEVETSFAFLEAVRIGELHHAFRCNLVLKDVFKEESASSARVSDAHEKSTDKLSLNKIPSSSPRNNSTRAPVPPAGIAHGIPPFHQDSTRLHSSQYHPGADGMQHHQHAPVRAPAFLQLVTELPDSTKGGAKGQVMVRGAWAGSRHPARPFSPNYSLDSGSGKKGPPRGLGGKGVFCCLSKLFEIDAKERQCKTLLTARNLMAVVREPQEYVINILPRKMPKEVVPGEHYIVKDLPIYQALKEADAEKRRAPGQSGEEEKRRDPSEGSRTENDADSPPKKTPAKGGSW